MKNNFPIAALDIETTKCYKEEDLTELGLQKMFSFDELGDII